MAEPSTHAERLALGRELLNLPEGIADQLIDGWSAAERAEAIAAIGAAEAMIRARRWLSDPVGWIERHVRDPSLETYQADVLATLVRAGRLAVRSPFGVGKTATAALAILWFGITRDACGINWKAPTTASVGRQLTEYLWPEVHTWARRLDPARVGRDILRHGLQTTQLRLDHGHAWAMTANDPALMEGAHAQHLLYVYDEAKRIPDAFFDSAEGAFSGAGGDSDALALALAISTPGGRSGRFYDIHRRRRGLEHWATRHITLAEGLAAGRITREWAERQRALFGEQSASYRQGVLGEFATASTDAIIDLDWVEAAQRAWAAPDGPLTAVGVDVGRTGDETVVQPLCGMTAGVPRTTRGDTYATTGLVYEVTGRARKGCPVVVDTDGIGAGVYDELRQTLGPRVQAFHGGSATKWRDHSGELSFANKRAAAWWHVRDLLTPAYELGLTLPLVDELAGDLTTPTWRHGPRGAIYLEAKDDIKARIGRSPDHGDALAMACWGLVEQHRWRQLPSAEAMTRPRR